ncbi:hypothetical protein ACFO9Q_05410 [Paenibacillus sp. GCM10023252]|uniref:hypothetical protein n=1 Tax=Paenibacillus sp. GCM10023252 TaxID=3252649 RepID=UPI00360B14E3
MRTRRGWLKRMDNAGDELNVERAESTNYREKLLYGIIGGLGIVLFICVYIIWALFIEKYHLTMEWYVVAGLLLPWALAAAGLVYYNKYAGEASIKSAQLLGFIVLGVLISSDAVLTMLANERTSQYSYNRWVSERSMRIYMLEDTLRKHDLIGLDRQGVVNVLGAPEYPNDYKSEQHFEFLYMIGSKNKYSPPGVGGDQMRIRFNKDGKVEEIEYW